MKPVPVQPDSAPPVGVDYDMWLGPAPKRPFNPNRFHFNFRWFWDYVADHAKNFVAAMQANDASLLKCGIETGAIAAINAHMGNVAYKTGRKVYWDAAKGAFKNDAKANGLIQAHYHNGWKLPK